MGKDKTEHSINHLKSSQRNAVKKQTHDKQPKIQNV